MAEFLERKMRNLFKRFDIDGNGTIEESDFDKWADRLIALGNLDATKAEELRKNIKNIWTSHFKAADKDGDGNVSCYEFLAHVKDSLADEAKRTALKETLPLIYDAVDINRDGSISKEEFANFFKSLNIDNSQVAYDAFQNMDVDGDGGLSKEEFTSFGRDFFLGTDPNHASQYFFGPLA